MSVTTFSLIAAVLIIGYLFVLLRSRRLREKYVALWMLVGLLIVILALAPGLLGWFAGLVGIAVPANLLFFLALVLLLGVSLQLTLEISKNEEKTRTLAERVAILELEVQELRGAKKDPSAL